MKFSRKVLLAILGLAHTLNHSFHIALPPLVPLMVREFNVSLSDIGLVATLAYFMYGFGALLGGRLSDKVNVSSVIAITLLLSGLSSLILLFQKSLLIFSISFILISFWASFYHPASNTLLAYMFRDTRASAMGIHGALGSLGQIIIPTIAIVLALVFDWRTPFIILGLVSILTSTYFIKASDMKSTVMVEKDNVESNVERLVLLKITVFTVFIGLYFRGVELYLPTYLKEVKGFTEVLAGIALSIILFSGMIGQILTGRFADVLGDRRVLVTTKIGVVLSLISLQIFPEALTTIIAIVVYGLSYYGHQPAFTSFIGRIFRGSGVGSVYGLTFFMSFGLSSVSAFIAGYISTIYGLTYSYMVLTAFALAALATVLTLRS
ncbi:MAG: MFS transporter [Candidatus Methanomethylicia archaeon]